MTADGEEDERWKGSYRKQHGGGGAWRNLKDLRRGVL